MLRIAFVSLAAAAALASTLPAAAEDAFTTRIEPNNVYGATITVEEGVRVFRPLPSERHVIVNPNGTPLSLYYGAPAAGPTIVAPNTTIVSPVRAWAQ